MDIKRGSRIGKYEVIGKIAQGGMGALYKARHPTLDRVVLLKKLAQRGGSQFVERFKREARLMMDFKNEHIVQVYDHFKEGPHYYIVEEFVDGISLDELIRRERYLSNDAATLILYEVCKALKYAHDKQVIHRDIKPGNILISHEGEIKLADFGIATSGEEAEDGLTRDGMMLGTPAYAPPEQIENARSVDRRADIYSVGVVLYEMVTGRTPFPGSFTAETLSLIHKGRYVPPRRLNPRASPLLCGIVRTCMRVKPRRRYQDLGAVIRILSRRIRRRDPASIQTALKKVLLSQDIGEMFRKRRAWRGRLVAAVVLLCVLGSAGFFLYRRGYGYEYFEADRYGALVVAARVDAEYKDPGDVFFKPVLYREQAGEISLLPGIDFHIREDRSRRTTGDFLLESQKLYLPAGRYRLKVNLEGQLSWFSFSLSPRTAQRAALSTLEAQRIDVRQDSGSPRELQVTFRAREAGTGTDLTDSAELRVLLGGRWVRWGLEPTDGLVSGRTYRFRIEKDGYFPAEFNLIVRPFQDALRLEAELVTHPGTLSLRSDSDGVTLLLDGSPSYSTGGRQSEIRTLEPIGKESRVIVLKAGEYQLTARRGSSTAGCSLRVEPDRTAFVEIGWDADRSALDVAQKE
jgi:eukaryotic-like serine/threonine-protein kinase